MLKCGAVWCSVLQRVAEQGVAVRCSALRCVALRCSVLQQYRDILKLGHIHRAITSQKRLLQLIRNHARDTQDSAYFSKVSFTVILHLQLSSKTTF